MIIQHNIAALNSYSQLTKNNSAISSNLEKLSSGYKINRAGDDAAGLAISEKMRAQITGLETAQDNANDGISLVQTAEGALTEVHDMLNRMVELATQSSNGTYSDEVDRENLQAEVDSLIDEIDRIAESTNFNGINLLDGSMGSSGSSSAGTVTGDAVTLTSFDATKAEFKTSDFSAPTANAGDTFSYTVSWTDANGKENVKTVNFTVNSDKTKLVADDGTEYTLTGTPTKSDYQTAVIGELQKVSGLSDAFTISADTDAIKFEAKEAGKGATITGITAGGDLAVAGDTINSSTEGIDAGSKLTFTAATEAATADDIADNVFEINGKKFLIAESDVDADVLNSVASDVTIIKTGGTYSAGTGDEDIVNEINRVLGEDVLTFHSADVGDGSVIAQNDVTISSSSSSSSSGSGSGNGLTLQIGDTADDFNKITVNIDAMDATSLGIAAIDISTADGASAAIEVIKNAINTVSSTRGDLGAIQNRLEHTINNLTATTENITSAESRIRDTDMAEEMMAYTKNNILVQASQAMLAQANTLPQGVLQLLQ